MVLTDVQYNNNNKSECVSLSLAFLSMCLGEIPILSHGLSAQPKQQQASSLSELSADQTYLGVNNINAIIITSFFT